MITLAKYAYDANMSYKTGKVCITKYTGLWNSTGASVGGCTLGTRRGRSSGRAAHGQHGLCHCVWPRPVFREVIPLGPASGELFRCQTDQHFAKKPFVFGQEAAAVLHCDVQCPPLHFWEGDAEIEALIKHRVQCFLWHVCFSPSWPPLVW